MVAARNYSFDTSGGLYRGEVAVAKGRIREARKRSHLTRLYIGTPSLFGLYNSITLFIILPI